MNRRELLKAMLAAPVVALLPTTAHSVLLSDPIKGLLLWYGGMNETTVREADTVTYTYDVDVAVGVCEGPVQGIQRIWADGFSPMGRAAGVEVVRQAICVYDKRPRQVEETDAEYAHRQAFTAEIEKRLTVYYGTETQAASPLIESREGQAPTYRGLHYVTLEKFPVEPFGNRTPDFWFESEYRR